MTEAESFLRFESVDKYFDRNHVVKSVSLSVARGEIFALLGPSGSGKTTLLRLLAGFESPDLGRIVVDGEEIQNLAPARRGFGLVFQSYALFPHRTVAGNIRFGLESAGWFDDRMDTRVRELLELVDLVGFGDRRVTEISGGQQQRVALARALAPEPRILMLDEPLSNLDPTLREKTRRALREILQRTGTTTLLVTHEQEEAFEVGDRVGVLCDGVLEQVATPEELYEQPATPFVASFIGQVSTLQGMVEAVESDGVRVKLLIDGQTGVADWLAAPFTNPAPGSPVPDSALQMGSPVDIVVRPEGLKLSREPELGSLAGTVRDRRYTGPLTYYTLELDGGGEVRVVGPPQAARPGDRGFVSQRPRPLPRIFLREARPPDRR